MPWHKILNIHIFHINISCQTSSMNSLLLHEQAKIVFIKFIVGFTLFHATTLVNTFHTFIPLFIHLQMYCRKMYLNIQKYPGFVKAIAFYFNIFIWPVWMIAENFLFKSSCTCRKYGSLLRSPVAHQTRAYPVFCSMKWLGVFLLPSGWDASPSQGYPQD